MSTAYHEGMRRLQDRFEVVSQDVPIAALGAASLGGETAPALAG